MASLFYFWDESSSHFVFQPGLQLLPSLPGSSNAGIVTVSHHRGSPLTSSICLAFDHLQCIQIWFMILFDPGAQL